MAVTKYAYCYAVIDENTKMCIRLEDTTLEVNSPLYIPIEEYNRGYLLKYYNQDNGKWYYDSTFQNEWIPE